MLKVEGMAKMDEISRVLLESYDALESLYTSVSHPVSPEVQFKADAILRQAVSVSCMALNFKEFPAAAKKPVAALLYAAADAMSGEAD